MPFCYECFLGYMLHNLHALPIFQMSDTTIEGAYNDMERSTASTTTTANVSAYCISFHCIHKISLILAKKMFLLPLNIAIIQFCVHLLTTFSLKQNQSL